MFNNCLKEATQYFMFKLAQLLPTNFSTSKCKNRPIQIIPTDKKNSLKIYQLL